MLKTQAYVFSKMKQWPVTLIPWWKTTTIIVVFVGSVLGITDTLLMQRLFQKLGNILRVYNLLLALGFLKRAIMPVFWSVWGIGTVQVVILFFLP